MQRLQTCAAALSMVFLTGCAPIHVSSYRERGVDFAQYQTYDWGPAALSTGDPRLDSNPFFHDYFQRAVDRRLAGSGLRKSASGTPDLVINYHASMSQSFQVSGADRASGTCANGGDCEARVIDYEAGTLVLDFKDTRTNQVVWRASVQQSVDGLIDNQDWMEKYLDVAVDRMLERLPAPGVPARTGVVGYR
jgi:hypothetical protein